MARTAERFVDRCGVLAANELLELSPFLSLIFPAQRAWVENYTYKPDDPVFAAVAENSLWKKTFVTQPPLSHIVVEPNQNDEFMWRVELDTMQDAYCYGISVQRPTGVLIGDILRVLETVQAKSKEIIHSSSHREAYEEIVRRGRADNRLVFGLSSPELMHGLGPVHLPLGMGVDKAKNKIYLEA